MRVVIECHALCEDLIHDLIGYFPIDTVEAIHCLADWLLGNPAGVMQTLHKRILEVNPAIPQRYRDRLLGELHRYGISRVQQVQILATSLVITDMR